MRKLRENRHSRVQNIKSLLARVYSQKLFCHFSKECSWHILQNSFFAIYDDSLEKFYLHDE